MLTPINAPATTPPDFVVPLLFSTGERARLDRAAHAIALVLSVTRAIARVPGAKRRALRAWKGRLNDRHYLAGLSEFQVHEMGLTLSERDHEVQKPFWEA